MDEAWEKDLWESSWAPREEGIAEEGELVIGSGKRNSSEVEQGKKRRKVESSAGEVWCEKISEVEEERREWLERKEGVREGRQQTKITHLTGLDWIAMELLRSVSTKL